MGRKCNIRRKKDRNTIEIKHGEEKCNRKRRTEGERFKKEKKNKTIIEEK